MPDMIHRPPRPSFRRFQLSADILLLSILLLVLSSCEASQSSREDPAHIISPESVEEVWTLSNETSMSQETPLVAAVSMAVTDDGGNRYLADPSTMKIHAYGSDGSYRWTAGGEGSGPGSFNEISALYAGEEHLYVYDYPSSAMTQYTLDGKRVREWTFGEGGHSINQIRRLVSGEFLVTGLHEESETLVSFYSADFRNREQRLARWQDFARTEHPELEIQVFRSFPGSVIPIADSTAIFTPASYNGTLSVYHRDRTGQWSRADTLVEGYSDISDPLLIRTSSEGNDERSHLSGFNPEGGYFHTEFRSLSHGLYNLENGLIAHLSYRLNNEDRWNLVIERFDPKALELRDYTVVEDFITAQQPDQLPIWMDEAGRIYLSQQSDTPLRVIRPDYR